MRHLFLALVIGLAWAFPSNKSAMEPTKYTIQKRSQLNKNDFTHLVVPHNGKDSSAMKDLNETITSMTGTTYVHAFVSDGATKWFYAGLNSDQVKELEGNSRVNYIVENLPIDPYRADSIDTRSYEADLGGDPGKILPSSRSKRDQQKYTSQIEGQDKKNMPPDELRIMSTPEGVEWECRAKYYYPSEAGEGIQIDSIEEGILPGFQTAFENRLEEPLLTDVFNALPSGQEAPPTGHATCGADKAMGKYNGAAKKSTLRMVRLGRVGVAELAEALKAVVEDVKTAKTKRSQQPHNRILLLTWGSDITNYPHIYDTWEPYTSVKTYIRELFYQGIPVVASPANRATATRDYPSAWTSDDFPLIVVGFARRDGSIHPKSWQDPKVTTYAMGEKVTCVGPSNGQSGSSFAAPLVAGALAVFMSQKQGPFYDVTHQMTGLDFVKAARQFVKHQTSYLHDNGARMFWNLVPLEAQDELDESG